MSARPIDKLVAALRRTAPQEDQPIPKARADFEKGFAGLPAVSGVDVHADRVGGVPVEWIVPIGGDTSRVVVYLHGGGYAMGSVGTIRTMASYLALRTHTQLLTVDYRLAPEHPFPAGLDDVCAVYRALLDDNRFRPEQIVIGGDSAGGGLTMASLVKLRDEKVPLPAGGIGISPWLDLAMKGNTLESNLASDPFMRLGNLDILSKAYLGNHAPKTPLASPLYADLRGLPPLLVQVGMAEILLDDSRRFAARAEDAGVNVTLSPWQDMIHDWHMYAPKLPEALEAMDEIGNWLKGIWP